jgi:CheY-like chemotaxis protein
LDKLKVLIVDDDFEVSSFIKKKLGMEAPHLELAAVESAQACLEYLKDGLVDCIVSDYQMPVMDGMELLKALNGMGSDVPFIFLTGKGGEVKVICGKKDEEPDTVFVEVTDTGMGIPEEDLPHVFDKYFRSNKTKEKRGTGLGLAIVKAAADTHGGKVEVQSTEDKGSTFRLLLPAASRLSPQGPAGGFHNGKTKHE